MNDKDLNALFESAGRIPLRTDAKVHAIDAAMSSFDEAHSSELGTDTQGNADLDRPTSNIINLFRGKNMYELSQRWVASGIASAAVVVFAVTLAFNLDPAGEVVPASPSSPVKLTENAPGDRLELLAEKHRRKDSIFSEYKTEESELTVLNRVVPSAVSGKGLAKLSSNVGPNVGISAPSMSDASGTPIPPEENRDSFQHLDTNPIKDARKEPVSTFSIDVDTASYSYVRRQLNQGVLPQKSSVRLEEMVNYFPYSYPVPKSKEIPFATHVSVLDSPWRAGNKLVHIGIKGYEQIPSEQIRSNLVFLLDVSGSMNQPDKLPLVKQSMSMLLSQLQPEDTVAIVVYAGAAGAVLEPTSVKEKQTIMTAMNSLDAGGSTAGAAGIKLAYQLAEAHFVENGVNRIFLATDGDFNVGITDMNELQGFVERKRNSGVYLSVLGFGQGNYQDQLMQALAQNGNGIAAYIDTLGEAQKVLVDEASSMLFPIANDVKVQIEFNPATVKEYRLLGYESRMLQQEDFNNDAVDAGEIGAGHSVTAIYEVTPLGEEGMLDESRYQPVFGGRQNADEAGELGFLKIRYKLPGETTSRLLTQPVNNISNGNQESRFAVAVAGFAQLLKDGKYTNDWSLDDALEMAINNKGPDIYGYRAEFTQLVRKAMTAENLR